MQTQLVLWDWNGTLLDDVDVCVDGLNHLLAAFHYPQSYDLTHYREIFDFPIRDYYQRAGFDFTKDDFDVLAREYMAYYIPTSTSCGLTSGARETLSAVKALGCRQVILSASPLSTLQAQVAQRGLSDAFDQLLGLSDIYAHSKVDLGVRYFETAGVDPARAVMVGDTVHDFEVSRALGCRCVLFSGGHQPRARLKSTGAPVIDALSELPALL